MLSKGDKIGEYTLLEKVGSGGFGDVWKAEKRTALDVNHFALKFFRPKEDQIDFEKIAKELAVWKQLRGLPHIISVIELDKFDDYIYLVSDFADGGSLEKWLKDNGGKASSEAEAIKITIQILTGLENLHEKGFVHRDIKPDNILIMNGKFCLADFGVSREVKSHSKATGTAGTMEFMPPEAFKKKPSVTPQTDIWAVGVILQKLLTGELPYPQEDQPSLITAILMDEPDEMPESISEGLQEIVKKALQKDRDNRFQTAREMRVALRNPKEFLASLPKTETKLSSTIVDEDFDKTEILEIEPTQDWKAIEAEKKRKEEEEKIQREAEEKIRQEVIEQERQRQFRELEAEKERQRLQDLEQIKSNNADDVISSETSFFRKYEKPDNIFLKYLTPNFTKNSAIVCFTGVIIFGLLFSFTRTANIEPTNLNRTAVTLTTITFTLCLFFSFVNFYLVGAIGNSKWAKILIWMVLASIIIILIGTIFIIIFAINNVEGALVIPIMTLGLIAGLTWLFLLFLLPLAFTITALSIRKVDLLKRLFPLAFPVSLILTIIFISANTQNTNSTNTNSNIVANRAIPPANMAKPAENRAVANSVANEANYAANKTVANDYYPADNKAQTSPTCSKGVLVKGANIRSTPYVNNDNIVGIWSKGAELQILSVVKGQTRAETGNPDWCKVKVYSGTCTTDDSTCDNVDEGYIHADLIECK